MKDLTNIKLETSLLIMDFIHKPVNKNKTIVITTYDEIINQFDTISYTVKELKDMTTDDICDILKDAVSYLVI